MNFAAAAQKYAAVFVLSFSFPKQDMENGFGGSDEHPMDGELKDGSMKVNPTFKPKRTMTLSHRVQQSCVQLKVNFLANRCLSSII